MRFRLAYSSVLWLLLGLVWIVGRARAQIYVEPPKPDNRAGLTARGTPRAGNDIVFEVQGAAPTDSIVLIFGTERAVPIPPIGTLCIGDIWVTIGFQGATARTVLPTARPGAHVVCQALVAPGGVPSHFTNTVRIFILGGSGTRYVLALDPLPRSIAAPDVMVQGTATASGSSIRIDGGASPVTTIANQGPNADRFAVRVPLAPNRRNRLFLTETTPAAQVLPPVSADVLQDSLPPEVHIDFPQNGQKITAPVAMLAGRISDSLSGFEAMTVFANGAKGTVDPGIGTNGTFEVRDVPLQPVGQPTQIVVTAKDGLGNSTTRSIVLEQAVPSGVRMAAVPGGDGQRARVGTVLPVPIAVRMTRPDGITPFCRKTVTFTVTRSDGGLGPDAAGATALVYQVDTDLNGIARAFWRLGTEAGCGNNRVEVQSKDVSGFVAFCASADAAPAKQINIGGGNAQCAQVWSPVPEQLVVWVSDERNPAANVPVVFEVTGGDGTVAGAGQPPASFVTVPTSVTGHAGVVWTLGGLVGQQTVRARLLGQPGVEATFVARGLPPPTLTHASWSGCVFDNAELPIDGVTARLEIQGQVYRTTTGAQGAFTIPNIAESGPGHLYVVGATATRLAGKPLVDIRFPDLHYEVVVVPGIDNTLPRPVSLPALRTENDQTYDEVSELRLTCAGLDGLELVVAPGSMWLPDRSRKVTTLDRVKVSVNKVDVDRVPMPMNDGASPPYALTLQPGGYVFDPPVRIRYPNMSGLPPGSIAYFMSFDHDTGKFEIVASGSVTSDGSSIVSDPNDGIKVGGWHCNCPPYSVTKDCKNCFTTCRDGSLSGGAIEVTNPEPRLGQWTSFKIGDVIDSGGESITVCPDGTTRTPIPGVAPQDLDYHWVLTAPDGSTSNGPGREVGFTVTTCGVYRVTWTVFAHRACAPDPFHKSSSVAAVVADPIEYSLSLPLSAAGFLVSIINSVVPQISISLPGDDVATLDLKAQEICCKDPTKTDLWVRGGLRFPGKEWKQEGEIALGRWVIPYLLTVVAPIFDYKLSLAIGAVTGDLVWDGCEQRFFVSVGGHGEAGLFGGIGILALGPFGRAKVSGGVKAEGDLTLDAQKTGLDEYRLCAEGSVTPLSGVLTVSVDPWIGQPYVFTWTFVEGEGQSFGPTCTRTIKVSDILPPN
jgi:hypothetical protein